MLLKMDARKLSSKVELQRLEVQDLGVKYNLLLDNFSELKKRVYSNPNSSYFSQQEQLKELISKNIQNVTQLENARRSLAQKEQEHAQEVDKYKVVVA